MSGEAENPKAGGEEQKGTGDSSSARGNLVALKRFQKLKQLSEAICKFQELETPRNREPTQLSLIQRPHDLVFARHPVGLFRKRRRREIDIRTRNQGLTSSPLLQSSPLSSQLGALLATDETAQKRELNKEKIA
ncbi:hypothetical protein OIU79_004014 [Salix purpurea]|uniref:Uncharacterized protein n=1 Tax=Salix purpurea TaxID=77065 RepID=A0A9Q0Z921_SALPP|nr:hypothetical protein OIU79_004014 [Salix purpurea]